MRRLHLTIQTADGTRARHAIADRFPYTLGRQLDNDLPIPFTSISGRHVSLDMLGDQILVTDLGSTNGTFIGTHRLSSHHPTAISEQHPLRLGDLTLNLKLVDASGEAYTMAQSSTSLHEMVHSALDQSDQSQLHAFFEILSGPGSGRRFALTSPTRHILGSGERAALQLPDANVAAQAASVHIEDTTYIVTPLHEATLLLDQNPITEPTPLISGARLQVGGCELVFVDPLEELVEPLAPPAPAHRPTVQLNPDTDDLNTAPGASQTPVDASESAEATRTKTSNERPTLAPSDASDARQAAAATIPRFRMEYLLIACALVLFAATTALLWAFL